MKKAFLFLASTLIIFAVSCKKECDKTDPNSECYEKPNPPVNPTDGVKINGVTWSTRNVDKPGTFAAKPESFGMFYQWNRKIGWSSTDPMKNSNNDTVWDSSVPSGERWVSTNDPCPSGWRVPTRQEIEGLLATENTWTQVNGVNGRQFGSGDTILFFPAAGRRYFSGGTLGNQGIIGSYWSSTPYGSELAYYLDFHDGGAYVYYGIRYYGRSVRCVAE